MDVGSRNRPLRTALAPAVRVIVITMWPLTVVQVHARLERRDRLRAQHGARRRVADLHRLGPALVVPVDEVQLEVVRLAVAEVDVDGEAGGGVPDGGDAVGRAGDLEARGSVEVVVQV